MLTSGVMYECIRHDVDYVLAGSIRDDGPLPDTIMDLRDAQDRYARGARTTSSSCSCCRRCCTASASATCCRRGCEMVCVDINPAVVTKLADRGSTQTIGIVTDVGLFLHQLAHDLR